MGKLQRTALLPRRLGGRELAGDRLLQHHGLNDVRLGDPELARLLGDLHLDRRRAREAGADHVCAGPMCRSLLGHYGPLIERRDAVFTKNWVSFGNRFIRSNRSLLPPRPV